MRSLSIVVALLAGAVGARATIFRSQGWIEVDPGYCVDADSLTRDSDGLTHLKVSPHLCDHREGHIAVMDFIFDCPAVRKAATLKNGRLEAGYSYRTDPGDDWQRSMTILREHVGIARFACGE